MYTIPVSLSEYSMLFESNPTIPDHSDSPQPATFSFTLRVVYLVCGLFTRNACGQYVTTFHLSISTHPKPQPASHATPAIIISISIPTHPRIRYGQRSMFARDFYVVFRILSTPHVLDMRIACTKFGLMNLFSHTHTHTT